MSTVAKGGAFEEEVGRILRLKGYTVGRNNLINGTQIDLHATRDDPLDNISFVVECADREAAIGVDLVKEKASVLLSLRDSKSFYRLLFVSRNGFTAEAKAFAAAQPNVVLLTLTELEELLVNLTPYAASYVHNYEHSMGMFKEADLAKNYVALSARQEKGALILSLDAYIRKWLETDSNNLLFLLGDYGAGKTCFCRHLVYELLREKYIQKLPRSRFTPILINLREVRGKLDLKKVVTDTLVTMYGVDLPSFAAFEQLCSNGNMFLVLDGFDEMSDRCDMQALIDSFNQIYLLAALDSKVLLTSRSNVFRSHADLIELLKRFSISVAVEDQKQVLELSLKDHGQLLYVEKLSAKQVREFVQRRFGHKTDDILATIQNIHDLSDLSTRPVLLDMIASTLPELQDAKRRINSSALYEHYTDRWTTRDQWRVTIPLKVRQTFCEMLAWTMHSANIVDIPFTLLEEAMVNALTAVAKNLDQLERFKNDIQTCSFLVRSGEKNEFRFAHKSFVEFFVARKLINDLVSDGHITRADGKRPFSDPVRQDGSSDEVITGSRWGKAFMFDHLYASLNERVRLTPKYILWQEAEIATTWASISDDAAVRAQFESAIRGALCKTWLPSSSDTGITEEIATFALEHMSNSKIDVKQFVSGITDEQSLNIFCDVLRLGYSDEWIRQNGQTLKHYVLEGDKENLKIACGASIAKSPGLIDAAFLRQARAKLTAEGWSYVLFEVANSRANYRPVLTTVFENEVLSAVDKVICIYGLSGDDSSDMTSEKMTALVSELLKSTVEKERSLALDVCYALPVNRRFAVLTEAFREANSKAFKKTLMDLLQKFADETSWQKIRTLSAQESDPEIREALRTMEQVMRNINSKRRIRDGWNRVKDSRSVRETIWKWRK